MRMGKRKHIVYLDINETNEHTKTRTQVHIYAHTSIHSLSLSLSLSLSHTHTCRLSLLIPVQQYLHHQCPFPPYPPPIQLRPNTKPTLLLLSIPHPTTHTIKFTSKSQFSFLFSTLIPSQKFI